MHIGHNNTATFSSMVELAGFMTPEKCLRGFQDGHESQWSGGINAQQAISMLTIGDHSQIAEAEAMLAKFDIRIDTVGQQMDVGVAGFCPSVPDFLGGSPESMFYMAEAPNSTAPLKVIVDPTSSAVINAGELRKRGTSILAAVMALSAIRPVSLEIACLLDCGSKHKKNCDPGSSLAIIRVPINSTPIDLGSACYALCHAALPRLVMYGLAQNLFDSPMRWPEIYGVDMMNTRSEKTQSATIKALGEDEENTLFIPACCSVDSMVNDPIRWVDEVLSKYSQQATH